MCLIYISISSSSPSIHPSIIHHTFVYLPIWEQTMYKLTIKFPFSGLNTTIIMWSYTGSKLTCSQKRNQISNSNFLNHIYFQDDCWDQLNLVLTVTRLYVEMICTKQTNIPKIGFTWWWALWRASAYADSVLWMVTTDGPKNLEVLLLQSENMIHSKIWEINPNIFFEKCKEKLRN